MERLRTKVPDWHSLTYLTASMADTAGQHERALVLYQELHARAGQDRFVRQALGDRIQRRLAQRVQVLRAEVIPEQGRAAGVDPKLVQVRYGKSGLQTDRKVAAVLEINWIAGPQRPDLLFRSSSGDERLEEILEEVGISVEVRWSSELPPAVMGPDRRFSQAELMATLEQYRSPDLRPDLWHFYLIYGGLHDVPGIRSMMFDPQRRGAAIFTDPSRSHPNETTFEILHEMGHMLNLPHPWQAYGDTKSIMSFPFRWSDWSWDDPQVYRFDGFGQHHIRRAPDEYVRPGGSAFLDYGAPLPWPGMQVTATNR
jgi:hypothetical protein